MNEAEIQLSTPLKKDSKVFEVIKPKKKTWIFITFIVLICHAGWLNLIYALEDYKLETGLTIVLLLLFIIISGISVIVSLFFWRRMGKYLIRKVVVKTLLKHKFIHDTKFDINHTDDVSKKRKTGLKKRIKAPRKVLANLLSINIEGGTLYYIEEQAGQVDLTNIKYFFRYKMLDLITASIFLSFLLALIVHIFVKNFIIGMISVSAIILASPILASWILPSIWALQDVRLKYFTKQMNNFDLYEKMRKSLLGRFLSISGLFASFGFFYEIMPLATGLYSVFERLDPFAGTILTILLAIGGMIFVIILMTGTSAFVVMIYLSKYHEKIVNELRDELNEFIPHGITNVIFPKSGFI